MFCFLNLLPASFSMLELRDKFFSYNDIFFMTLGLRHKYVLYLFDVVTFSYDIRIKLYFVTFKLRTEIAL